MAATTECEDLLDLIDDDGKIDDQRNMSYNDESHASLSEPAEMPEVADLISTLVAAVATDSISANHENSSNDANGTGNNSVLQVEQEHFNLPDS